MRRGRQPSAAATSASIDARRSRSASGGRGSAIEPGLAGAAGSDDGEQARPGAAAPVQLGELGRTPEERVHRERERGAGPAPEGREAAGGPPEGIGLPDHQRGVEAVGGVRAERRPPHVENPAADLVGHHDLPPVRHGGDARRPVDDGPEPVPTPGDGVGTFDRHTHVGSHPNADDPAGPFGGAERVVEDPYQLPVPELHAPIGNSVGQAPEVGATPSPDTNTSASLPLRSE